MWFGKFKGVELKDLSDDYLGWLMGLDDVREPLRSAIEAAWRRRIDVPRTIELSAGAAEVAEELVTAGYRALAKRLHPDHGGTVDAMTELNEAVAALRSWLREQTGAVIV